MASWNIKSAVRRREERGAEEEVRGLIASLPLRYRRHHVMFSWGSTEHSQHQQEDWRLEEEEEEEDHTSQLRSEKENQPRRSNKSHKKKMKRRFFQGSLTNLNEDEDVRNKSIKSAANHINQIIPSANYANRQHHNLGNRVRPQHYHEEDSVQSHRYLLHFLLKVHNNPSEPGQLYKSLSNPELNRAIRTESQSRYVFPVVGRQYDVEKMEKYLEKKKRSREEFPLGEVTVSKPIIQQERELEICEIVPDQLDAGLLY